jgi:hypothetical protein
MATKFSSPKCLHQSLAPSLDARTRPLRGLARARSWGRARLDCRRHLARARAAETTTTTALVLVKVQQLPQPRALQQVQEY